MYSTEHCVPLKFPDDAAKEGQLLTMGQLLKKGQLLTVWYAAASGLTACTWRLQPVAATRLQCRTADRTCGCSSTSEYMKETTHGLVKMKHWAATCAAQNSSDGW